MSTQSAGVGGTGPKEMAAAAGLGRRVGGEGTRMLFLSAPWTLCDVASEGGGPGGGGGSGIPGSHLVCEVDRERPGAGELIAPVDAAQRAAGGPGCCMAGGEATRLSSQPDANGSVVHRAGNPGGCGSGEPEGWWL